MGKKTLKNRLENIRAEIKAFEEEREAHLVFIKELKVLLQAEESPFSKLLIQQNIVFYQISEMIAWATSVITHASMVGMCLVEKESGFNHFQIRLKIDCNTTLGKLIGIFESISAPKDHDLIKTLNEYNKYRNNLIHKIIEQGKYKNIQEIKDEAEKAILIGDKIIMGLDERYRESEVYIRKLTPPLTECLDKR